MVILNFLGRDMNFDDNLLYHQQLDYWVKKDRHKHVLFGLTQAGAVKEGGYRSIEFTVREGDRVQPGDTIAVAITNKIKYLDVFTAGRVVAVHTELEKELPRAEEFNCTNAWLIRLDAPEEFATDLISAAEYCIGLERLNKNALPQGKKAAGSPTCRSVYEAIKEQKY